MSCMDKAHKLLQERPYWMYQNNFPCSGKRTMKSLMMTFIADISGGNFNGTCNKNLTILPIRRCNDQFWQTCLLRLIINSELNKMIF